MFALVSSDDIGRKVVLPIRKVRTVIGRDAACDIILADDNVSRTHAKIYFMENRIEVKDMGSRNGTYLNNQKLEGMKPMKPGDELIIGSNLFHLAEQEGAGAAIYEMTGFRTVDQLRDPMSEFDLRPGEVRPPKPATENSEQTIFTEKDDLVAGIYGKKLALARYASMEILFGKNRGAKFLLPPGKYNIGRGDDCNIRLDDEKVSARHASLTVTDAETRFEDLGSTNGSIVNNRLLKKAVNLKNKDIVLLGHTKIKFIDPKTAVKQVHLNVQSDEKQFLRLDNRVFVWLTLLLIAAVVVILSYYFRG